MEIYALYYDNNEDWDGHSSYHMEDCFFSDKLKAEAKMAELIAAIIPKVIIVSEETFNADADNKYSSEWHSYYSYVEDMEFDIRLLGKESYKIKTIIVN